MWEPELYNADTNEVIRPATRKELADSIDASIHDGGRGIITVDGIRCYVM